MNDMAGDLHSMGDQLRQAQIRYTGINALGGTKGILIRFFFPNSKVSFIF